MIDASKHNQRKKENKIYNLSNLFLSLHSKPKLTMNQSPFCFINNPRPTQDVPATNRLNNFAAYFRATDTYKELCSEEGFELNYNNFEWEYTIKSKNNQSFIVLTEYEMDNGLLRCYLYPKGDEVKNRPDMIIPSVITNENMEEVVVLTFEALMENDPNIDTLILLPLSQKVSKNPNHNRPTTKGSNHTPPKKKRK